MSDIVNLRAARKLRARQDATARAAANRTKFGRGKARRLAEAASQALSREKHEAHRREGPPPDAGSGG